MSSNTSSEISRLRQSEKMDRTLPKAWKLFSYNSVTFVIIFVTILSSGCSATDVEEPVVENVIVKGNDNSKIVENKGMKFLL